MSSFPKASCKDETVTSPTSISRFYGSPNTIVNYDEQNNISSIDCNCQCCHIYYEGDQKEWDSVRSWLIGHNDNAFKDPIDKLAGKTYCVATKHINDFIKEYYPDNVISDWDVDYINKCFVPVENRMQTPDSTIPCITQFYGPDCVKVKHNKKTQVICVCCTCDLCIASHCSHQQMTCVCCTCKDCLAKQSTTPQHFKSVEDWSFAHEYVFPDPLDNTTNPDEKRYVAVSCINKFIKNNYPQAQYKFWTADYKQHCFVPDTKK